MIFGTPISGGLSLTPRETRLPFILTVKAYDVPAAQASIVLVTSLILAFLLMIAAAYGLYRVTTREIMLARQQSDFVSAVSHEFRTPLTSMRHLTELLAGRGNPSAERRAQYYKLLAGETERLHRMVEGLLSFGRIEAGAYAWQLEPADVGEMVRVIVDEFRKESAAAGREIVSEIAEDLPSARIDRDALSRALWNLLENAAKYSDPGKAIHVFVRKHQDSLLVDVEDKGAGIPASEREKIFHKFVRGADAKRAGIRGVGIGLALVQRIIEAHGGSVRVESEPGRGSTFTLVIPCLES
jgi:signal transduction histidine kinase